MNEIDDEFGEIEESAGEKQKKIVDKKMEELRDAIDKSRKAKTLSKDIKNGLEELKNEIVELEKPLQVVPFNPEGYSLIVPENRTELEELGAWKKYFRQQSPEVVFKHVEGLENFFMKTIETNSTLKETKVIDKFDNLDVQKLSESISGSAEMYMNLAKQVGDSSGLGLFVTPAASAVAAAATVTHGVIVAGALTGTTIYETTREGMKEYALETQKDLKDHIEHHADNAEKLAEKVLDNTKEVINKGIEIFDVTGAAKNIAQNLADKISEAEIKKAEANAKAREEELDGLRKQIKELKEEKEKQVEKLEERIRRKDDRIDNLEKRIRELEGRLDNSQEKYLAQVEETAKIRSTSPMPYLKDPQ